ncbi:hypothetical protein J6590_077131 [Homalodisca vitripennis]|nr:hypothetical protein J6590_077131 [Homalodisca vitripennis]
MGAVRHGVSRGWIMATPVANRKKWDPERMKCAVLAAKDKEIESFKAARIFNVPQTTIERFDKIGNNSDGLSTPNPISRPATLKVIDDDLAKYCIIIENKFYGLTTKDVRSMAFRLANLNGVTHKFPKESQLAGKKWLKGFFQRNKQQCNSHRVYILPELVSTP